MLAFNVLIAGLIAAASATSLHAEDAGFAALLKRQTPGSPAYNCHDNCGQAIKLSRLPNMCELDAFKADYQNCLLCSGPDNYNIWRMYGQPLAVAGSSCGLSTSPLAGKQADVGAAIQAGTSGSDAPAMTTPPPVYAATATPPPVSSACNETFTLTITIPKSSTSVHSTATMTGSVQQSTNAAVQLGPAGMLGAVVLGAIAAL